MVSKKEISSKNWKNLLSLIVTPSISDSILKKNIHFIAEYDNSSIKYLCNRKHEILFFKYEDKFYPTIQFIRENPTIDFPIVKVDQGAVSHIINGADIFTQGIKEINKDFNPNTIIMIANPQGSILALGKSIMSSNILLKTKGKGIINVHYLGDSIWDNKL